MTPCIPKHRTAPTGLPLRNRHEAPGVAGALARPHLGPKASADRVGRRPSAGAELELVWGGCFWGQVLKAEVFRLGAWLGAVVGSSGAKQKVFGVQGLI